MIEFLSTITCTNILLTIIIVGKFCMWLRGTKRVRKSVKFINSIPNKIKNKFK